MSIAYSMSGFWRASKAREEESLESLALRLQARQEGALESLIARTQGACSRLALSILHDPELSRDALQESYFVVYQRIGQLRDASALKSWLFRIVQNCCHNILRSRERPVESELETEIADPGRDPGSEVDRQESVRATFARLPEIDRTALALREVCGMSYDEMSEALGIPLGTVRSRLAKARKRFIDAYQRGDQ